ncbi:hypothetical protein T08_14489 [Trichinella sp. T8]|nr:hypothetical protein T08_14489 [Trichinella sp. T8]
MKIQQLDSSEAEIILCGRKWTRTGLTIEQSTEEYNCTLDADQALLSMETSTDFVRTPDDAVVCACHRCAGCTQSKGSSGIL